MLHTDNFADAEPTAAALRSAMPNANVLISHAGSVLGTYAGPGAIGIALLKSE